MPKNDLVLLDSMIKKHTPQYGTTLDSSELFELFVFDQLLKPFDPTYHDLETGWVDGGNDGGIDGFFVYVDGRPATKFVEKTASLQSPEIDLIIVSARSSAKFEQQPIDSLHSSLSELLDLTKSDHDLSYPYNRDVLRQRSLFSSAYIGLVERKPQLSIRVHYCSRGDVGNIAPNLIARASSLEALLRTLFGGASISFIFQGATELLDAARRKPNRSLRLPFTESFISREGHNFVILTKLVDYYDFVTDEKGDLRRYLFESNVRDYLGSGAVNRDIANTIRQPNSSSTVEDFWWLNNGVTILCTNAAVAAKKLALENVQIINGLQTTETLYEVYKQSKPTEDNRAILVKIIATADDDVRAKIVKATNYQSTVDLSSLRGLDKIQRDIELYFEDHGWFYDRRRNYFKNQGKPADRIVEVTYLASAIRAVALGDPANSPRQRAKSLRDDNIYSKVFSAKWDLSVFLTSLEVVRAVELAINPRKKSKKRLGSPMKMRNVHFIAYILVCSILGKSKYRPDEIVPILKNLPSEEDILVLQSRLLTHIKVKDPGAKVLKFHSDTASFFLKEALQIETT